MRSFFAISAAALTAWTGFAPVRVRHGQPTRPPRVEATLVARAPVDTRPRTVRLVLVVSPGWHIGAPPAARGSAVGLPTNVRWTTAPGWRVVAERWPEPQREIAGRDTALTYTGRIEVDADLDAPAGTAPGLLRARIAYGICRDVCIPGWVTATLDR